MKDMIYEIKNDYKKIWWDISKEPIEIGRSTGLVEKLKTQRRVGDYIKKSFNQLEICPVDKKNQCQWREEMNKLMGDLGDFMGFEDQGLKDIFFDDFFDVTHEFLNQSKLFDPNIKFDIIGQAMRNVWIMNVIQMLFDMKVEHTPSIFAYSMLYPYTDNYLDSTEVSINDKIDINERFGLKLKGEKIEYKNAHEKELFTLVDMIEGQYSRKEYKDVYESLLIIHNAQERSLFQQRGIVSPYERDIIDISFEKGGASVIADACLVKGSLSKMEADFMFGYGALLQLCDDLQDAKTDLKNGHMTVYSQTAGKWPLDNITNALFNFLNHLIDNDKCFNTENGFKIKDLIKKNVMYLIIEAISQNQELYTKSYIKRIEEQCSVRMNYIKRLGGKLEKRYKKFKNIYGMAIDDVILTATNREII